MSTIMDVDDTISSILSQCAKVDIPVLCKNYDYVVRDVERVWAPRNNHV